MDSLYHKKERKRICQGDILEDFQKTIPIYNKEKTEIEGYVEFTFPYVVILSQDCDLRQDAENRSLPDENEKHNEILQSVLIIPAFMSEELRDGSHLLGLGIKTVHLNGTIWNSIERNNNKRYYFLKKDDKFTMPSLAIDFKIHYTIKIEDIYKIYNEKYKISIKNLFRESISRNFSNYISRIGLPELKK